MAVRKQRLLMGIEINKIAVSYHTCIIIFSPETRRAQVDIRLSSKIFTLP